jgi:hypothetical protein
MPEKRPPRDPNELAEYILDVTTGEAEKIEPPRKILPQSPWRALQAPRLATNAYHLQTQQ